MTAATSTTDNTGAMRGEREPTSISDSGRAETLVLYICKSFSGEIIRVSVDPEQTPTEAIPAIADRIGYTTPDWEKIGMYNLTRDFEFDLDISFSATRVRSGDLVIMADGAGCHKSPEL